ncbi:MAG TPA: hypothetical protein VGJ46_07280 [Candidatus Limnocylindrales bacterium]|jgi:hypothetical protein
MVSAVIPAATVLGNGPAAAVIGGACVLYVLVVSLLLRRRQRSVGVELYTQWVTVVVITDVVVIVAGIGAIVGHSVASLQVSLIALLARPMLAFLLVISAFGSNEP